MKYRTYKARRQAGFTLLEIVVAIAIVAMLAAFILPGLLQNREDAKYSTALTQLQKDFPSAITRQVGRTNTCTGITKPLLETRGLPVNTVWNLPWTLVSATTNIVTITYPIDSTDTTTAPNLVTALTASNNVASATNTGNASVTVRYRCN